uniref:Uncharacterized protein n=1 Tax=Anopheles atroparvus TaxID=41427 RepID=A0AAG5CR66_ANOAO
MHHNAQQSKESHSTRTCPEEQRLFSPINGRGSCFPLFPMLSGARRKRHFRLCMCHLLPSRGTNRKTAATRGQPRNCVRTFQRVAIPFCDVFALLKFATKLTNKHISKP